nr:IS66 family insertion sequence element accessory protein TnpB [Aliiroseovarius lamellibrachiae]
MRCCFACDTGLQPGACGRFGGSIEEGAVIFPDQAVRIVIATKPVDFRKGHDGLAAVAHTELGFAPKAGVMVVFRSKRGDRIKVLFWDGSGVVMIYKRLEQGAFAWPKVSDGVMRLSRVQFEALFAGLDWRRIRAPRPLQLTATE